MENLKISIITATFNRDDTISDTINSVLSQSYNNIEYIIVDGGSEDGTIERIKSFGDKISKFISEPDSGMYDAINKGIKLASGEIVGIINSDDFFYDRYVIEKVASAFDDKNTDAVFGDVVFVKPFKTDKIVRYYSSKNFHPNRFRYGYMPAHTGFYARRKLFNMYGFYKLNYKVAADFELLVRFLYINKVRYKYLPVPVAIMRTGGISNKTLLSRITLNNEIVRACRENNLKTNLLLIYLKYFNKIFEYSVKESAD